MEWTRGPIIGRGSTATVSLANTVSGEVLAVKSTDLTSSASLQKEQSFLSQLCSPYIVNYIGSQTTLENNKKIYNLFMEYMPAGTLADLIKKQGSIKEESLIKLYAHQILKGLNYLHSNGIIHCDMKGQNILIGKDGVKIADLGCAKMIQDDGNSAKISGTPIYMAPEVARGEEQGFGADIWAFGCTIIEMATGFAPWSNMIDPVSVLYRLGFSDDVIEFPDWLSSIGKDFLSKCLMRNAKDRWSAEELLEHPFLDGIDAELYQNSPKSILDSSFWDSMEVSDSDFSSKVSFDDVVSFNSTWDLMLQKVAAPAATKSSPSDRIRQLVCSSDLNIMDWSIDEDWITIRDNLDEEKAVVSEEIIEFESVCEEWMDFESPLFLVASEEEVERLEIVEDLLLSHFVDDNNVSGNFTDKISPVNSSGRVENEFVSTSAHFDSKAITSFLILLLILMNEHHKLTFISLILLCNLTNFNMVNTR